MALLGGFFEISRSHLTANGIDLLPKARRIKLIPASTISIITAHGLRERICLPPILSSPGTMNRLGKCQMKDPNEKLEILVVDDEADSREALAELLLNEG